jgi:hypothetical protein
LQNIIIINKKILKNAYDKINNNKYIFYIVSHDGRQYNLSLYTPVTETRHVFNIYNNKSLPSKDGKSRIEKILTPDIINDYLTELNNHVKSLSETLYEDNPDFLFEYKEVTF